VLGMADRILVMHAGRITGAIAGREVGDGSPIMRLQCS